MTKEELAGKLNGRQYGSEMTREECAEAKSWGLLVIFGASDDLCELRGVIEDECGAYREALILISQDGRLLPEIDDEDVETLDKYDVLGAVRAAHERAIKVSARWCKTPDYSWTYETAAPHATFDILEAGGKYCRGIVLDLRECALAARLAKEE